MLDKNSYLESKKMCEDLGSLMGIEDIKYRGKDISYLFFHMLRDEIVHIIAEKSLDSNKRIEEDSIVIPFIGKLKYRLENNEIIVESFDINKDFSEDIKRALTEGISPINEKLNISVVNRIKNNYKSLM